MGDSAGGHLDALVGLAADQFTAEYRGDANYAVPANVKVVIGVYGVYDIMAARPARAPARPDHGEVPRRVADAEPAGLF